MQTPPQQQQPQRVVAMNASLQTFSHLIPALKLLQDEADQYRKTVRELEQTLEQTGRTSRSDVQELTRITAEIQATERKHADSVRMRENVLRMGYNVVRDTYNESARPESCVDAAVPQ